MRALCSPLLLLASVVLFASSPAALCSAYESASDTLSYAQVPPHYVEEGALFARDGMHHGHHHAPLTKLNETDILQVHSPTPPSYGTHDFEDPDVDHTYPYLMGLHILFMSLAFFGALPMGIALRSVKHRLHALSVTVFYGFLTLGLSCSALYRKLTPNLYEHAKHGPQGYFVLFFALCLTAIDVLASIIRALQYVNAVRTRETSFSFKEFWKTLVLNEDSRVVGNAADEYTGLVSNVPEDADTEEHELKGPATTRFHTDAIDLQSPTLEEGSTGSWDNDYHSKRSERRHSLASDGTVFAAHGTEISIKRSNPPLVKRVGHVAFATAERVLVFVGYMQVLTGVVTYTGICRESYVNGCLAHLIKGGIFWCYGLVTFARFVGSFSELGWAWNQSPRSDKVLSAEFVECLVIFGYGISNTWMERFGIAPGSPYSTKEIQHISIAVMFWFAGLVGMGLESRRVRHWLATPAASVAADSRSARNELTRPASYRASFNPFPALVIGVTGIAMAAHAQVYLFQVQIHALWGQLLAGFAVLRCLTYFFLFLSPPSSVFPGRPPTEALASFFLACGGLVFQLSTEEITLAAMRRGHDDVMMFLNVAVAFTCLALFWVLGLVSFKGWLKTREVSRTSSIQPRALAIA